jgi:spermidine synthase
MTDLNTLQPAQPLKAHPYLPLLMILFVGSGCSALIYEIVWLQLLQLVIGSTAISLGVLLGTFMGGMCIGSLLLPRLISPRRHPLRAYAILELFIGIIAFAELKGLPYVTAYYTANAAGATGLYLRAGISALCLLPPTILMGATLPAISRWIESTAEGVSWLGFFYAGNIVGAVIGCLAAGFYLLPTYSMPIATYVAVGINVLVATAGLFLAASASYEVAPPSLDRIRAERAPGSWAVYLAIAISGLTGLGAEVIWTRILSLMLGATVYTFSIILAVFLLGLGIGSTYGSFLARSMRRPRMALAACQLLLAGCVGWAAYAIVYSLPYWPINLAMGTSAVPAADVQAVNGLLWQVNPWIVFQIDLVQCAYAILPAAILWGASFPLALAGVVAPGKDPGKLVGGVYAANTLGAIAGSISFSLFVIPYFGTPHAQQVLIILSVVSGLLMIAVGNIPDPSHLADEGTPIIRKIAITVAAIAAAVGLVWSIQPVPWGVVAFGRQVATWIPELKPEKTTMDKVPHDGTMPDRYCLYVGEGMNVTVAVTQSTEGWRYFHGAGKVQASSDPQDMRLQRMLGHLSALIQKKPEKVLVVACGAGVTAGSFVPYPSVKKITICDIEPLVPKQVAQTYFNKENNNVVTDERTTVVIDDGRHFISTLPPDEKFDIITSDPIDPWVKGCAALNTVEYYQMCKKHLNPGGVMSLWIPLYENNMESSKTLISTFFSDNAFPNGILFSNDITGGIGYDAVLFGQAEPTRIDIDAMQAQLNSEEYRKVRESLSVVGFGNHTNTPTRDADGKDVVLDLLATYAGQAHDLKSWMQNVPLNTDDNLRLQYLAGKGLNSNEQFATVILNSIFKNYRFPTEVFTGSPEQVTALEQALEGAGRTKFAATTPANVIDNIRDLAESRRGPIP